MEAAINLLLASYSLEELLEQADVTEEAVVELLIEEGLIDLERFFDNG